MGGCTQWKSGVGRMFFYISGTGSLVDGTKLECKVISVDKEDAAGGHVPIRMFKMD